MIRYAVTNSVANIIYLREMGVLVEMDSLKIGDDLMDVHQVAEIREVVQQTRCSPSELYVDKIEN